MGKDGSRWHHGYIPANAAAVALKQHKRPGSRPEYNHSHGTPVAYLAAGRKTWNARNGLPTTEPKFSKITMDPNLGIKVAKAYDKMPSHDPAAEKAWDAFGKDISDQYDFLTKELGVKVTVSDKDPYKNVDELIADLRNHKITVLSTKSTGGHPYFSNELNDKFRAVHDAFAHSGTGRGFDRNGEEAAFQAHYGMMRSDLAKQALATETRGQNSVLNFEFPHKFPEQKIAILPNGLWKREKAKQISSVPVPSARRAREANAGGFSYNRNGSVPTHGYMVSLSPANGGVEHASHGKITAGDIARHESKISRSLADEHNYQGGWHDPETGATYLDVSRNHGDIVSAAKAAKANKQLAIYDVKNGKSISTSDALRMAARVTRRKAKAA